jgi:hypothetical protein
VQKIIRRIVLSVSAIALVGVTALSSSGAASASAGGCAFWNPFSIKGIPLATGRYCVSVIGSGSYTAVVTGQFVSAGPVCNWNITAEFFNSNSQWLRTYNGPQHYSCSVSSVDGIATAYTLPGPSGAGFVCSTLKVNGTRVTSWCAGIHP